MEILTPHWDLCFVDFDVGDGSNWSFLLGEMQMSLVEIGVVND